MNSSLVTLTCRKVAYTLRCKTRLRLDADAVVNGSPDSLLAAQVSFGNLHGHMPKKELNLVQFSAGAVAQLCTGPA